MNDATAFNLLVLRFYCYGWSRELEQYVREQEPTRRTVIYPIPLTCPLFLLRNPLYQYILKSAYTTPKLCFLSHCRATALGKIYGNYSGILTPTTRDLTRMLKRLDHILVIVHIAGLSQCFERPIITGL